MAPNILDHKLYNLLKSIDTPTVCNAIEVAIGKRGFNQFTKKTLLSSAPSAPPIVGFARTAIIAGKDAPSDPPQLIKAKRMAYYRYMSENTPPSVVVIEDKDGTDKAVGAYWGEINANVHRAFGFQGALTNGVMRDLDAIPQDFPVLAGSIGPSHAFVHVRDINVPVSIMGLKIKPNDLIHADKHGAVVIPQNLLNTLEDAIHKLIDSEKIILEPTKKKNFSFDDFQVAWNAFEKSRV
jgi:regulator of RNase E activity RraA